MSALHKTKPETSSGARIVVLRNNSKYAKRIYDGEKKECQNQRDITELNIAVDRDSSNVHSYARSKNKSSDKSEAQIPFTCGPSSFHFI
jgi:hypothetical protein